MGLFKKFINFVFDENDNNLVDIVRASDNGEEWAKNEIQKMWESNDETLIPRINEARVKIYENSAKAGDRQAILYYARGLAWCNRKKEALEWYMKLINQGDTDAMLELAFDYTQYGGMGENPTEEFKWIQRAAQAGNAEAQTKLGTEYQCKGDRENAYYWHKKSAEQGHHNGRAEYAKLLIDDMHTMSIYLTNREAFNSVKQYQEQINKYNLISDNDFEEKILELYDKSRSLSEDVCDEFKDEMSVRTALDNLTRIYLFYHKDIIKELPYHAAHCLFISYDIFEDIYYLKRLWSLVKQCNLKITQQTLDEWADISLNEWAEKYNIKIS